ncbi:uncharacterized protein LY89DRAFT_689389 [Mollisia scopiformis]|uniref:Uncharacterized protein n=1 Tax=Mollisia scopiformis TaxID=149040 RepID=A0A194WT08_MOLSC|nr:uncharacterized protein LY89DRAFT_689389 [Mollisia scopiformis]KUJ10757.1 hypothetical protein LY89DRAFT_689389 [Mollisia scopiformis]
MSIDTPIHVSSCYATSSRTLLPAYSTSYDTPRAQIFECGCPDADSKEDDSGTPQRPFSARPQPGDRRDLESAMLRPMPKLMTFWATPPGYGSIYV